jgi:hypothetical protein
MKLLQITPHANTDLVVSIILLEELREAYNTSPYLIAATWNAIRVGFGMQLYY